MSTGGVPAKMENDTANLITIPLHAQAVGEDRNLHGLTETQSSCILALGRVSANLKAEDVRFAYNRRNV